MIPGTSGQNNRLEAGAWTLEFGHFGELRRPRDQELGFLGVERGSGGPKGQENLAQDLPWVLGLSGEALKGAR